MVKNTFKNLRVKYLIDRARALEFGKLWNRAKFLKRKAKRPAFWILIDMLACSVIYECAFSNYQDWEFYALNRAQRKTYMTDPKSDHLALLLNSKKHTPLLSDKTRFNQTFQTYIGREWLDLRHADTQQVANFIKSRQEIIAKVPDKLGGNGISRLDATKITDVSEFIKQSIAKRQFLIEDVIEQHPDLNKLNPSSVNSVRVVSYFDGERTHILSTALKIGNGGAIDNFSGGGMYTMLNENGIAIAAAFDGKDDSYAVHPLTGVAIAGFQLPYHSEMLSFVEELSRVIPEVPYVGWDIAITPNGPIVIEGNYNTGVFQAKPSTSGIKEGLLPVYRAAIGF